MERNDPASRGPDESDRLGVLVHELSNLIDGSLRCLQLAWSTIPDASGEATVAQLGVARRQVETVHGSLERMVEVMRDAMGAKATNGRLGSLGRRITLAEALFHALDVVRMVAGERRVQLKINVESQAGKLSSGPVYPAVLNALHNAIEAVHRTGEAGTVEVSARIDGGDVVIEVADDGDGPSDLTDGTCGVGLAICRSIMDELDGWSELVAREASGAERPGAVMRLRYPASSVMGETMSEWIGDNR